MKKPNMPCPKCGDEMYETVQCMLCVPCNHEEPLPSLIARPDCPECKGSGEVPNAGFSDAVTMECFECRAEMPGLGQNVKVMASPLAGATVETEVKL